VTCAPRPRPCSLLRSPRTRRRSAACRADFAAFLSYPAVYAARLLSGAIYTLLQLNVKAPTQGY
jgi:hypothetical protein